MGLIGNVLYYSFHPSELRAIMQWLVCLIFFERS